MLRIGVIGYGYWGPNIVRNLSGIEGVKVVSVCDKSPQAQKRVKSAFPGIKVCSESSEITASKDIDIVAVITPVSTHFDLAREALTNGKHVFVEKPFTATAAEAMGLIEIAEKKNLKIMVDHTFLFTSAVRKIKEIIDEGVLGDIYYYDSTRINLGLFQHDVNVVWDLAPHDFSIMDYLIGEKPVAVSATGQAHLNGKEDVAYVTVFFNDMIAHFNVNWLSPVKLRNTLIGGEKKMLLWNDISTDEKIKVYDRGVDVNTQQGIHDLLVNYRSGDVWAPRLDQSEALKLEAQYFVDCVNKDKTPFNDGLAGLRVVKMLEACSESLGSNGRMIEL